MNKSNRKKLIIDARPLARGSGGIQRYLRKILRELILSDQFEITLYSDRDIADLDDLEKRQTKQRVVGTGSMTSALWYFWTPIWLRTDNGDIYWSPRHHLPFLVSKNYHKVVSIHDFVWKQAPDTMPTLQRLSESLLMPFALKRADKVICISNTTSNQLRRYYPKWASKDTTILHGHEVLSDQPKKVTNNRATEDYLLSVGTLEPRKNYAKLIQAFDTYHQAGGQCQLVIIGKQGWRTKEIYSSLASVQSKDKISIISDAGDSELESYYRHARGFISASIDEGYGLPPQEALSYGLPLLLSDIEVYRELYPRNQLWCNPDDVGDISEKMHQLSTVDLAQIKDQQQGRISNNHTWEKCALEHIAVFEQ